MGCRSSLHALLGGAATAQARLGLGAAVGGGAQTHKHHQTFVHLEEELPFANIRIHDAAIIEPYSLLIARNPFD